MRPGLKTGVENGIFWSEIGSGFGDAGSTPPPKIPRSIPPGYISKTYYVYIKLKNVQFMETKLRKKTNGFCSSLWYLTLSVFLGIPAKALGTLAIFIRG